MMKDITPPTEQGDHVGRKAVDLAKWLQANDLDMVHSLTILTRVAGYLIAELSRNESTPARLIDIAHKQLDLYATGYTQEWKRRGMDGPAKWNGGGDGES